MGLFSQVKEQLANWMFIRQPEGHEPKTGLYHYLQEKPGERTRIHLRIDPDGSGLLIVNASRVYHLNASGTTMAYLILEKLTEADALTHLSRIYQVSTGELKADYAQFNEHFAGLLHPDDACPICDLELETTLPFTARPTAPYRMDLALTYRCNNDCAHCYNARPRNYPELNTDEWKHILDRLWELRIPHVVFTGGEPTLRKDLPDLIRHAEQNGQITGLNTNARQLSDDGYLDSLVSAGLDHVQVTLESHDPGIHNAMVGSLSHPSAHAWEQTVTGIQKALKTRLFMMTNTTMLRQNSPSLDQTLDFLAELGVPTVGLNALIYSGRGQAVGTGLAESELYPLLEMAREKTERYGQRLIWYTPTEYCHFDPIQMELGVKGCTAALYNMCVEPDGSVIPCQSYYRSLGNLLADPWEAIWEHDLAVSLRERQNLPVGCVTCGLLSECGGGCPLAREAKRGLSTDFTDKIK
jgi:radical SAM protein with 4Fe4S-binding SPASM domain